MNVTEGMSVECGYEVLFNTTEASLQTIFGNAETFCCYDTCQFPDYSKVVMEFMDPVKKTLRREEVFQMIAGKRLNLVVVYHQKHNFSNILYCEWCGWGSDHANDLFLWNKKP